MKKAVRIFVGVMGVAVGFSAAGAAMMSEARGAVTQGTRAGERCSPRPAVRGGWDDLDDRAEMTTLLEGSYRGHGFASGDSYELHLGMYLGRRDHFSAVLRNRDRDMTWIGFIKAEMGGVFAWYPLRFTGADETGVEQLEPALDRSPVSELSLEFDSSGRMKRVVLAGLAGGAASESIEFTESRSIRLWRTVLPGRYEGTSAEVLLTGTRTGRRGACGALFTGDGGSASITRAVSGDAVESVRARVEASALPGVFLLRRTERNGYLNSVSDQIEGIAVVTHEAGALWSSSNQMSFFVPDRESGALLPMMLEHVEE